MSETITLNSDRLLQEMRETAERAVRAHNDFVRAGHIRDMQRWRGMKAFVNETGRGTLFARPEPKPLWVTAPADVGGMTLVEGTTIIEAGLFDLPDDEPPTPQGNASLGNEGWPGAGWWWPGVGDTTPVGTKLTSGGKSYTKVMKQMGMGPFQMTRLVWDQD